MEGEKPYSYHKATELGSLLRKFGKFPCIHQSMGTMMYGTPFATLSKELISILDTRSQNKILRTHVGIEYLNLSKSWVHNQDTSSGLAYEPVASKHVKRRAVQRVGMYGRGHYLKSREYC